MEDEEDPGPVQTKGVDGSEDVCKLCDLAVGNDFSTYKEEGAEPFSGCN